MTTFIKNLYVNEADQNTQISVARSGKVSKKEVLFSSKGGQYVLIEKGEKTGIYFIGKDDENKDKEPLWLSSILRVVASTCDLTSNAWGRLLEWVDDAGVTHTWAMPMELLVGDSSEVKRELLRRGVHLSRNKVANDRFIDYLQWSIRTRALCVERIGWHNNVYVLPDRTIGKSEQRIVFQASSGIAPIFSEAGTLSDWIKHIALPAQGNSRLVFSISLSLAGALLDLVGEDCGGFHSKGSSSIGKSTALYVTSSTWAKPSNFTRSWRATCNGLEGIAASHNDNVLPLDEIGECDVKSLGNVVYMLANGQGKARANKAGGACSVAKWKLIFYSTGEESLAALMAQAGLRVNAGQELRLREIPADAGAGLGLFENLHDANSANEFANRLKIASQTYYGTAGVAWLNYLTNDRAQCTTLAQEYIGKFCEKYKPKDAQGQVLRTLQSFAVIAAAGEMATDAGITGWMRGEAMAGSGRCFNDWLANVGGTENLEERAILAKVNAFMESHGSSRFEDMNSETRERIQNRVGYFKNDANGRIYFVFPEAFKNDICNGFDPKQVVDVLLREGILKPDNRGGGASVTRIPNESKTRRMYQLSSPMWSSCALDSDSDDL